MQGNPELSQTRVAKQVIKVQHNHSSVINIIPLINYVLTATSKLLIIFESCGESNR
jgi:hypothetical protein